MQKVEKFHSPDITVVEQFFAVECFIVVVEDKRQSRGIFRALFSILKVRRKSCDVAVLYKLILSRSLLMKFSRAVATAIEIKLVTPWRAS